MITLIDNYDSFTANLEHLLRLQSSDSVHTFRCDQVTVGDILRREPSLIVLSPGPGLPRDRGIGVQLIREAAGRIPILGVCLGHQSIAVAFGGELRNLPIVVHGKASPVYHQGEGAYEGLPNPLSVMRYHSWVIDRKMLPDCLSVESWLADGTIMGVRHREFPIMGIQYHPESFLSPEGPSLVRNFLKSVARTTV